MEIRKEKIHGDTSNSDLNKKDMLEIEVMLSNFQTLPKTKTVDEENKENHSFFGNTKSMNVVPTKNPKKNT